MSIDVDDTAFKDYKKSFDQYATLVKGLPADLAKQGQAIGQTKTQFNGLVAAMVAQTFQARQTAAAQKEADRLTRTWADSWRSVAKSGKDFAGSIAGVARDVIRMVGPLSLLGSLLGAGGLFGLDKLAGAVAGQRRSAMGLGVGYGQQSAFGLNFGRFVDTNSMLGNVSGALYNATSPGYPALLAAGISPQFLSTHNAAEVSAELLRRLPGMFGKTPKNLIGAQAEALGLNQIISSEDIVRYVSANPDERRKQEESYQKDIGRLDVDSQTQRGWQDFLTQLDRAGRQIETSLVKGLVALAEPIGKLSDAFANLISSALGSGTLRDLIDSLAAGIKSFAEFIGTETFKQDVLSFVSAIGSLAKSVKNALQFFGFLPESDIGDKTFGRMDDKFGPKFKPSYTRDQSMRSQFGTLDTSWITSGGADLSAAAKAISGIEGNYDSIGPATRTGDHGYGRYQVMGANVAEWTRKYYGTALSTDQFLANHAAQDAVFKGQFGAYAAKYGPEGAARAWFAGPGGMNNLNARDVLGTSVSAYSQKFQVGLGGITPRFVGATSANDHMDPSIRAHSQANLDKFRALGNDPYRELGTRPTVTIHNNTGANTIITTNQAINN